MAPMTPPGREPRFLTLADVAELLSTSVSQVYALVRNGDLRGLKIGGRGQWRVEVSELEDFIQRMYVQTDAETGRRPEAALPTDDADARGAGPA